MATYVLVHGGWDGGWTCLEMPFEHWPFLANPQGVAELLLELGAH